LLSTLLPGPLLALAGLTGLIALAAFLFLLTGLLPAGLLAWARLVLATLTALLPLIAVLLRLLVATLFFVAQLAALVSTRLIVSIVRHTTSLLVLAQ
jgi:hypothetical protein